MTVTMNSTSPTSMPGFSAEQTTTLMAHFENMITTELDRRFDRLTADMNQRFDTLNKRLERLEVTQLICPNPSDQCLQQDPPASMVESFQPPISQQSHPTSTNESTQQPTSHQNAVTSPPVQPTTYSEQPEIEAEEVGYFDPLYQEEQGTTNDSIANLGNYVIFKDVYLFVDHLKHLASYRSGVKKVISSCLRGTALMWYLVELTESDRDLLRNSDLEHWCTTLINRFKLPTSVALSRFLRRSYDMQDLRNDVRPRAFIMDMLRLARAGHLASTYSQLSIIWNRIDVSLRRDIPEPTETTSLSQFLDQIDAKTGIWLELANPPPRPQSRQHTMRHTNIRSAHPSPRVPANDSNSHPRFANVDPNGYGHEEYNQNDGAWR